MQPLDSDVGHRVPGVMNADKQKQQRWSAGVVKRLQLSTDGFKAYLTMIVKIYGHTEDDGHCRFPIRMFLQRQIERQNLTR